MILGFRRLPREPPVSPSPAGELASRRETGEDPRALDRAVVGDPVPRARPPPNDADSRPERRDPGCQPRVAPYESSLDGSRVRPIGDGHQPSGPLHAELRPVVNDAAHAAEVEALANERFAAVGGALLAALASSGLSARRAANVLSWFVVAQLALGPWRSRGEVCPAGLARRMGVSRWTEWRARRDAVLAGVVRDWSLPDPEARGYGRGAVRVVELAFVRTRAVTEKVAAQREERASRAERRRGERARLKAERAIRGGTARTGASPLEPSGAEHDVTAAVEPVTFAELTSPAAARLWPLIERIQARHHIERQGAPQAHPPPE